MASSTVSSPMSVLDRLGCYLVGLETSIFDESKRKLLFALVLLHGNIVVYAFAYWITQPVLPYLSKSLGADAVTFGYLQTVTNIMQILGGAAIGRYVDVYSPRLGMVVTTLGSAVAYLSLGFSFHTALLFLSRLPTCLMQCMQVAQSYVPKLLHTYGITEEHHTSVLMGRLALSYGLGMVPGSACGGFLAEIFGFNFVAFFAGVLSLLIAAVDAQFLADVDDHKSDKKKDSATAAVEAEKEIKKSEDVFGFKNYYKLLTTNKELRSSLLFTTIITAGFTMQQSSFSVAAIDTFDVSSSEMGMLMSTSAAVGVVVNTIGIKAPVQYFGEEKAIQYASTVILMMFLVYSQAKTKLHIVVLFFPLAVAAAFLYTVMTSLTSRTAPTEEQGSAIALRHATRSVVGIVIPPVAGYVLQNYGFPATGLSAASCIFVAVTSARLFGLVARPASPNPEKKTQ
ncbi:unnamed protein product [Amoebophrya sp. A120]|nr:unnamed protein product [Amoebophrya sp. A120]|eukprot:GSA120T00024098001.1